MDIKTLGIDLAKNIFQLHGVNAAGRIELKKTIKRVQLLEFIAKLPVCEIVMEACGGANYWARKFKEYGHEVKLISPQFVKPFVKGNKNDYKDAEAIVEASSRPSMRYVTPKTIELCIPAAFERQIRKHSNTKSGCNRTLNPETSER